MKKQINTTFGGCFMRRGGRVKTGILGLTIGVLLAATGANAQPSPNTPAVLDHLLCYLTAPQPLLPQLAYLQDQFDARINPNGVETIYDVRMMLFCNPVKKTLIGSTVATVPIVNPTAHMAMYRTTPPASVIPRSVPISNQFGNQTLITGEAEFLGVPSGKTPIPVTGGSVTLPAIPEPGMLDHMRCYSASGPSIKANVLLNDQFFVENTEAAAVLTPRLFCNPVTKTVLSPSCPTGQFCPVQTTPIMHPASHMACYLISPATPYSGVVVYNNQFVAPGTLPTVKLNSPVLLCVPSTKSEDWVPIPASPVAPNPNIHG
jgi:hypothetical protein